MERSWHRPLASWDRHTARQRITQERRWGDSHGATFGPRCWLRGRPPDTPRCGGRARRVGRRWSARPIGTACRTKPAAGLVQFLYLFKAARNRQLIPSSEGSASPPGRDAGGGTALRSSPGAVAALVTTALQHPASRTAKGPDKAILQRRGGSGRGTTTAPPPAVAPGRRAMCPPVSGHPASPSHPPPGTRRTSLDFHQSRAGQRRRQRSRAGRRPSRRGT